MYPAQLKTPPAHQIGIPVAIDHGMSLVHRMDGTPNNYLHEVSFQEDGDKVTGKCLSLRGYEYRCGWRRDGVQYWTWTKRFPLSVALEVR